MSKQTGKRRQESSAAPPVVMQLMAWDRDNYLEESFTDPDHVKSALGKWPVIWVNVDGALDMETVTKFGEIFDLHELAMEDIIHVKQRAKVDEYDNHIYIVTRMVALGKAAVTTEQLSLFLGKDFVLTFQDQPGDCLDPVRERIRKGKGQIRKESADYLAYILIDAVVDGYFPVLENLGERLETLEDNILEATHKELPAKIHEIKREILTLRRAVWPLRDAINVLCRDSLTLITDKTRLYFRDCYDHAIRMIDLIEMYRELGSDLMDVYLSAVSNRMNEVMKVLTIITSLFIPPTFIAGIYGMNFNPQASPFNMPELNWYLGYPFALTMMITLVVGLMLYLRSRGYLGKSSLN